MSHTYDASRERRRSNLSTGPRGPESFKEPSAGHTCIAIQQLAVLRRTATRDTTLALSGHMLRAGATTDAMATYGRYQWDIHINPAYQDNRKADIFRDGLDHMRSGNLPAANREFLTASSYGQDFDLAKFLFATTSFAMGDRREAIGYWFDVLKVGPLVMPGEPYTPSDFMYESSRMLMTFGAGTRVLASLARVPALPHALVQPSAPEYCSRRLHTCGPNEAFHWA